MPHNKSMFGAGLSFLVVGILFLMAMGPAGSSWVSNGQGTVPTPPAPTNPPSTNPPPTETIPRQTSTTPPEPTEEESTPTDTPTLTPTPTQTGNPAGQTAPQPEGAVTRVTAGPYVVVWDPASQTLTIYSTTPGARIAFGGAPPSAQQPAPPQQPATQVPRVVVRTRTPAPTATTPALTTDALRGKILFKSDRDGKPYNYYTMNPDGSDIQKLNKAQADAIVPALQAKEGFSTDGAHVVLGERRCYWYVQTCGLYILSVALDSAEIFSDRDPSHGVWFYQNHYKARAPVWSPRGNYIVFVANNNNPPGCDRMLQVTKGEPNQNPVFRRLTDVCANSDHPTFSPDGVQVAYAYQYPGHPWGISVLDVGGG